VPEPELQVDKGLTGVNDRPSSPQSRQLGAELLPGPHVPGPHVPGPHAEAECYVDDMQEAGEKEERKMGDGGDGEKEKMEMRV